jgi:hypothetical protein
LGADVISHKDGTSSVEGAIYVYQNAAPDTKRNEAWHNKFLETGSILKGIEEADYMSPVMG